MKGRLILAAAALALTAPAAFAKGSFPTVIPLPNGFQPEGVATGNGNTFYAGSIPTGAIFRGDLRTGQGAVFIQGAAGRAATGLKAVRGRLYVSGASSGKAFVYDIKTGALLKEYQLAPTGGVTFINDVVVTRTGAYFTDSGRAQLYRVPLDLGTAQTIPLTGDFQLAAGFNLNGIDATANGKTLLSVQTNTGKLFTISPTTGVAHAIDLHGATLVNGDGILLIGKTLYVVQNQDNKIAVVRLSARLDKGAVARTITSPNFDVPTTIARHGSRLYAVNARFGTTPTPSTTYSVAYRSNAKRLAGGRRRVLPDRRRARLDGRGGVNPTFRLAPERPARKYFSRSGLCWGDLRRRSGARGERGRLRSDAIAGVRGVRWVRSGPMSRKGEHNPAELSEERKLRPRGARKRRQVHFHVDRDEDQMLLRAAGRFGSQQKALIAALHALNEVLTLRDQVEVLESENSRQRRLLSEAQALFRSS